MKTVKVRIAVAVDPKGLWSASGWSFNGRPMIEEPMDIAIDGVGEGEARYWITAEIPVPEVREVEGVVEKAS